MFTEEEALYVKSQHLARIGTVAAEGQPDVSPVGYSFDGEFFYVGGMKNPTSRKYKNIANGNRQVAMAIDDMVSLDPYEVRGIKIYGTADIVELEEGIMGGGEYLRIKPTMTWSWGVDGPMYAMNKTQWN